jgi:transposase, IS6 family
VRSLVSTLFAQLPWSGGDDGRAESRHRSLHYRPLGSPVRGGVEQAYGGNFGIPIALGRVDETYVRVAGRWTYLYRAIDSKGDTIDFMLSPKRDAIGAKHFLRWALGRAGQIRPRVINVDGHPAYPPVIADLKRAGELGRSCRCRPAPYLNNIIEQDHRFIKKRIAASLWFRSVDGALNTIAGYEAMHMIRKGQIRWLPKGDTVGQVRFVNQIFGLAA